MCLIDRGPGAEGRSAIGATSTMMIVDRSLLAGSLFGGVCALVVVDSLVWLDRCEDR